MGFPDNKKLDGLFLNKSIKEIKLININDTYFCFEEEKFKIIDGGIQFVFEDYTVSLAFNFKKSLFDITLESVKTLLEKLTNKAYCVDDFNINDTYCHQKITNINTKWSFYHDLDKDNSPTGNKNFVPHEIFLEFENGQTLQIALIRYKIENSQVVNPVFDIQKELLVSLNHKMEIKEE